MLKIYKNEKSELTRKLKKKKKKKKKNIYIYIYSQTPQKQDGSDLTALAVFTHLCKAIHPHLNRVDSEITVNTD